MVREVVIFLGGLAVGVLSLSAVEMLIFGWAAWLAGKRSEPPTKEEWKMGWW